MNNLRDEYVAQGYDFYERPPKSAVPSFLGGFQPDAIAVKSGSGVVLEIKSRSATTHDLRHIAERFEGQPKWKFRVVYFDEPETEQEPPHSPITLKDHEPRIRELVGNDQADLALLLAWSVFEGIAKSKMRPATRGALNPLQIVERLEHAGVFSAAQAYQLRSALSVRNALAHGNFEIRPGSGLIEDVLSASQTLEGVRRAIP